ncbi:MAG: ATP-dependent Clp protease ATP-binding subunit, partial [Candidatus Scatosoma sp.]
EKRGEKESLFGDEKLMRFGVDLTQRAKKGKLDPVIGREKEIEKMVQVLCRRSKNNPVLIGEPGVGKSAIAEGLAQLIAAGDVPEQLYNKKVFSVDLAGMLAGAKYRGEFEERLKDLMQAVTEDGDILLFIDEIHTLVGAGASSENTMDAANILKPLLSRGEMQIVGATTVEEYRKYIEKDGALERRFTPIMVEEPSKEATVEILKGLRPRYEKHHGIRISDEAIESAVTLSMRYVTERFLPDKAIDLIDEAASRARIVKFGGEETAALRKQAEEKEQERKLYEARGNFARATEALKEKREIEEKIENERRASEMKIGADGRYVLGREQIAAIISAKTGIPLTKITQAEGEKLMRLEEELHRRIVGQNEAVSAVARAIRRARAGLKDPSRPIGSFIFVGPTGVGKTDLCKALAETLFGSEEQMIRLDMSEYMEKSSVSKLIGAAPGYVGYDDLQTGQLTEKVRIKPYCVVLFDEIEKAHPDVFNLLLQLLDDGRLTDNKGRTVSFKNSVIILTSNVGAAEGPNAVRAGTLGFGSGLDYALRQTGKDGAAYENDAAARNYRAMKERITAALKERFRPEFLNRLDDVIVFHHLSLSDVEKIGEKLLDALAKRLLEQRGIVLNVTPEAKRQLAEEGYEPELGARELKRVVQRKIEDRLSEEILLGRVAEGKQVTVDYKNGRFQFYS